MVGKKKIKAVVTGGAGFIGSHLVDYLVSENWTVTVIDNLTNGKKENVNPKAKLQVVDIRDYEKLAPHFAGADYLFHLAALPQVQYSIKHPAETNEVNVTGTLNILRAALAAKVKRVIYAASSSVYGVQEILPLTEHLPPQPKSPYGLQKYVGELYCQLFSLVYGLPTVCLRFFNVYGSRQNHNGAYASVIGKFLKQRRAGETLTITGDGEQTRDFTQVRDVVRANFLAATKNGIGRGEVINIGVGRGFSVNEIARLIGGSVKHGPPRLEPRHSVADNRLAKKLLGWRPEIFLKNGLAELKREILVQNHE